MKIHRLFIFMGMMIMSISGIGQITSVGLIGSATINGWDSDIDMVQDDKDSCIWTLDVTLAQGEVKLRANNDWAINWGSNDFPTGRGTQDGSYIPVNAGVYHITFNSCIGKYTFEKSSVTINKSSAVIDLTDSKIVSIYPNPAIHDLNIDLSKLHATGDVLITVFEMSGRKMMSKRVSASDIIKLDISSLKSGSYFLSVSNHAFMIGKKFNVVR